MLILVESALSKVFKSIGCEWQDTLSNKTEQHVKNKFLERQ